MQVLSRDQKLISPLIWTQPQRKLLVRCKSVMLTEECKNMHNNNKNLIDITGSTDPRATKICTSNMNRIYITNNSPELRLQVYRPGPVPPVVRHIRPHRRREEDRQDHRVLILSSRAVYIIIQPDHRQPDHHQPGYLLQQQARQMQIVERE